MYSLKELTTKTQPGCASVCGDATLHTDAFLCNKPTVKRPHRSRSIPFKTQVSVCKPCEGLLRGGGGGEAQCVFLSCATCCSTVMPRCYHRGDHVTGIQASLNILLQFL